MLKDKENNLETSTTDFIYGEISNGNDSPTSKRRTSTHILLGEQYGQILLATFVNMVRYKHFFPSRHKVGTPARATRCERVGFYM